MCKDIPRKAKPQLQLKLPRDMKCSMRSFYCQNNSKGTNKEKKVLLLLTGADDLLKREGYDAFFVSYFTIKVSLKVLNLEARFKKPRSYQQ